MSGVGLDKTVVSITNPNLTPGGTSVDQAGDVILYNIDISAASNVATTIDAGYPIDDHGPLIPILSGGFNSGDTLQNNQLDPGEVWHYTLSYTVLQSDIDTNGDGDGKLDNTATVHVTNVGVSGAGFAGAQVFSDIIQAPALNIVKDVSSITGGVGGSADSAGDVIHYAITVQNTGNMTLTGLTVTDAVEGGGSVAATPFSRRLQHRRHRLGRQSRRRRDRNDTASEYGYPGRPRQ